MSSTRTIWIVALVALLLSALMPQAEAVWQCEGRTCGKTPWFCCCVSPIDARDGNCGRAARPVSGTSTCPADCGCVLTIREAHPALRTAAPRVRMPASSPVLFVRAPISIAPLPTEIVARSVEVRGPPLPRIALAVPSLRAPPAA